MPSTIEPAASGRAKCRGCGEKIAKDELRLGARLPNPFDEENELTLWFHLPCGAYKRPEPFLEAAKTFDGEIERREWLVERAGLGTKFHRLTRIDGAHRASTGRAKCRHCKEAIEKSSVRIALTYYDEEQGRLEPAGFIHPKCARAYFEVSEVEVPHVVERVRHFDPSLAEEDLGELQAILGAHE